jgi:hypothetical protein
MQSATKSWNRNNPAERLGGHLLALELDRDGAIACAVGHIVANSPSSVDLGANRIYC